MADNLTTFVCRLSWNLGASTSWNPLGLATSVMGLLYLTWETNTEGRNEECITWKNLWRKLLRSVTVCSTTLTLAQNLQSQSVEWSNDKFALNWRVCVWKWSWPEETYCSDVFMAELSKATKGMSHCAQSTGQDWNLWPSDRTAVFDI